MKIAVLQITSELDYKKNLATIEKLILEGKEKGAEAFFLPEVFYSMSDGQTSTPYLIEQNNEHYKNIQALAAKNKIALIGGSAATLLNGKVVNRAFNFDESGKDLGYYDKIHLFACDLPDKKLSEAKTYTAGSEYKLVQYKNIKIGLGICFDVRFSEQALFYRNSGAHILTYPAAFTVPTGKAHWHTLLKARAIENQCFVVASAQWGFHNEKIQTYGHSLIIDPWGEILVDLKEGVSVGVAEIDLEKINYIRHSVLMNREN
jgi:predicted amidohydrolase